MLEPDAEETEGETCAETGEREREGHFDHSLFVTVSRCTVPSSKSHVFPLSSTKIPKAPPEYTSEPFIGEVLGVWG